MTTQNTREKLHTMLDLVLDINNQQICKVTLDIGSNDYIALFITNDGETLYNSLITDTDKYEEVIDWLDRLTTGNLQAIPGYTTTLEKQKQERLAQFEKLKAEFEGEGSKV